MQKLFRLTFVALLCLMSALQVSGQEPFWLGADISGTTQQEHEGHLLYHSDGRVMENTAIQQLYGMNAVRLRVWVNPKGGWCGKEDVLEMAQRAKRHGMAIMLDFHYSDWWADPGHQDIPAAWQQMNYRQMCKALAEHTTDVLRHLKNHDIDVRWVQVGNETTHGFLWPMGRAEENMEQYAGLTQAGYEAVKSVYPEAICIVHLDGGSDQKRYDFIFDGLKQYGARWDMIGLSVYPYWDQEAKMTSSDDETLQLAIANIRHLYDKYGSESMIVETGYDADRPVEGRDFMRRLIDAAAHQTDGHCHGVFYWAPELEGHYKLGAFRQHRPTVIMDAFREAAHQLRTVPSVTWDSQSLIIDGRRVAPVMGEIHYSRIPAEEWAREVRKMKMGGITMIACYVFWNHIEEQEGIFDWSGQRDLRRFLEICQLEQLPVVLRIGPFCHGEVRHGGIPDWALQRGIKTRDENPEFLEMVRRLYRQIYTQVQGLQWKEGGPVLAAQFDNEYGGPASYLLTLKKIANEVGFDLPFYTRTGWPELSSPMPFGQMIPLFGDYADGFWDRSIEETAGNYWQAFHFRPSRANENIGSEQIDYTQSKQDGQSDQQYPYFTCELGGGMMPSYHRRVYLYPTDAYSMATVKLGSGSNLLGYYMYHGGTNPEGKLTTLNEMQRTIATNYNDLPVKTYDFQAPLGEFGQVNPHYFTLRKIHTFMDDFGELLAPMTTVFPEDAVFTKGDDTRLRWCYRQAGEQAFVFVNNYERLQSLSAKQGVQFTVCGVTFPQRPMTVPADGIAIFPVNVQLGEVSLRYATAQLLAHRILPSGRQAYYFFQPEGFTSEFYLEGKLLKNVRPVGEGKPIFQKGNTDIYLLTAAQAECFGLDLAYLTAHSPAAQSVWDERVKAALPSAGTQPVAVTKIREAGAQQRTITIGVCKAAEEPTDEDFEQAAVYQIDLSAVEDMHEGLKVLDLEYQGDVARLYANGKLIGDNFYNGRHFQYALWRLPKDCKQLELRILPIQKDMPVYFPREADSQPGERVISAVVR